MKTIWPIEFTKLQFYLQKVNQKEAQKEIIVISIKASYRDLAKNLELMLMKVFFFSQVRPLKNSGTLYSLLFFSIENIMQKKN